MGKLVLLFTVLPLVDLWLLLAIGDRIGFWPTVWLTILTAVLGGYLAKREGRRVIAQWQRAVAELRIPEEGVLSGLLVLVGGVLLATPGVLSDVVGLALLFPPTRRLVADQLRKRLENRFTARSVVSDGFSVRVVDLSGGDGAPPPSRSERIDVIDVEGEVVESEAADREPKRLDP